jgi:hypothetical protein
MDEVLTLLYKKKMRVEKTPEKSGSENLGSDWGVK